MPAKVLRHIIRIDESKCTGCGLCVPACAEGALKVIDGKVRLVGEVLCDGLGACLGECPQGALTVEEREADEFSEADVVKHNLDAELPCGCPGSAVRELIRPQAGSVPSSERRSSQLGHWPVQLTLVPHTAPFLKGADIVLAAQCAAFAYAEFHQDFIRDHVLLIACPKLDNFEAHQAKLVQVLRHARPHSITVVHMEVPCCSALTAMAIEAVDGAGGDIPLRDVLISVQGEVLADGAL